MTEQNVVRERLLNSLMNVPHREIGPLVETYAQSLRDDPFFTAKFLAWTIDKSQIRDQQDAAIVALLQSDNLEHRDAGEVYLAGSEVTPSQPANIGGLPPFRILRIAKYLATTKKPGKRRLSKVEGNTAGILVRWLYLLQVNHNRFDGVVMGSRKSLKWLYKWTHFKPSAYAQQVLFDEKPPEGSKLAIYKQIVKETSNLERARLVMEHKIPFRVAQGLLDKFDSATAIALIEVMTPTEALNSQAMVERSGILAMEEVKSAFVKKVASADKSAASARSRKSAQTGNVELQEATKQAQEKAIAKQEKIHELALLVDHSGSLSQAIEVAREFAIRVTAQLASDAPRMIVGFNEYASEIRPRSWDLKGVEQAFDPLRSGGGTSMEAAVKYLVNHDFKPYQITFVTDGQEMSGNVGLYLKNNLPEVVVNVIGVGRYDDRFHQRLIGFGLKVNTVKWTGDYYAFDQVISFLGGPKPLSLMEKILEYDLPVKL
jgi:hypothetical protein